MSDQPVTIPITPAGEAALLIALGDAISAATTDRVLRLTAAIEAAALPGVTDLAPGYVTVLVLFDPALADADALVSNLGRLAAGMDETPLPPGKLVTIPVAYGGELGSDLADVAAYSGLSEEEVAARHAAVEYRVACPGFVPGWAYLGGLPPELAMPRRTSPRTRVPVGSVAIGGAQTGVYPFETPGGWNLIGRSPIRLFDPDRSEPALLLPGNRVRFTSITAAEYHATIGTYGAAPRPGPAGDRAHRGAPLQPVVAGSDGGLPIRALQVLTPGLLTTVQDLGRPGGMRHGIGREGGLDRAALVLGNRLVGNQPDAAGLEITLVGPRLRFTAATVVAVTGADLGAMLDGQPLPTWQPVLIPAAGELTFDPRRAAGHGARAYLCLAGGIDVPVVLGSRSTYLAIGIGGHDGRPLRAGDVLPIGRSPATPDALLHRRLAAPPPDYPTETVARVVFGPQKDRFTPDALKNLAAASYRASSRSDRMGLRLEDGPPLAHSHGADLISEGIVPGSIQVPGDGLPIVLLHACATAGGYPKVATVIGADLDRMGQVRPGDRVRFAAVAAPEARRLTLEYRDGLGPDAIVKVARPFTGWTPTTHAANAATGAGIAALIDALRSTTVATVKVELRAGESRLALDIKGGPATD